jgi:hypothetical protein
MKHTSISYTSSTQTSAITHWRHIIAASLSHYCSLLHHLRITNGGRQTYRGQNMVDLHQPEPFFRPCSLRAHPQRRIPSLLREAC